MFGCKKCGKEMSILAKFCNQCGARLPLPPRAPTNEESKEYKDFAGLLGGECSELYHLSHKTLSRLSSKYCHACGIELEDALNEYNPKT